MDRDFLKMSLIRYKRSEFENISLVWAAAVDRRKKIDEEERRRGRQKIERQNNRNAQCSK